MPGAPGSNRAITSAASPSSASGRTSRYGRSSVNAADTATASSDARPISRSSSERPASSRWAPLIRWLDRHSDRWRASGRRQRGLVDGGQHAEQVAAREGAAAPRLVADRRRLCRLAQVRVGVDRPQRRGSAVARDRVARRPVEVVQHPRRVAGRIDRGVELAVRQRQPLVERGIEVRRREPGPRRRHVRRRARSPPRGSPRRTARARHRRRRSRRSGSSPGRRPCRRSASAGRHEPHPRARSAGGRC